MMSGVRRNWVVVGGGVSGISCVGHLLANGYFVDWVDPDFTVGRMGKYYRTVPANTTNEALSDALLRFPGFDKSSFLDNCNLRGVSSLFDLPPDGFSELNNLVLPLEHITSRLVQHKNVRVTAGLVKGCDYNSDKRIWRTEVVHPDTRTETIHSSAIIAATGAHPRTWSNKISGICFDLDTMLCTQKTRQKLKQFDVGDRWTVVGSSHRFFVMLYTLCV